MIADWLKLFILAVAVVKTALPLLSLRGGEADVAISGKYRKGKQLPRDFRPRNDKIGGLHRPHGSHSQ